MIFEMKVDQVQFTIEQIHQFSEGRFNLIWQGLLKEAPQIGNLINCGMLQGEVEAVVHYVNCSDYSEFTDFAELTRYSKEMGFDDEYDANLTESAKVNPSLIQRVVIRLERYPIKERYSISDIFENNPESRLLTEIVKISDDEFRHTIWRRRNSRESESVDFRVETK